MLKKAVKFSMDYLIILSSIISLLINICSQLLIFRYIPRLALLKSIFLGFSMGFLGLFMLEFYYFKISSYNFFTNFIIYSALGYCYFNFVTLGETARRIRLLTELYNVKEGLSISELMERYNSKHMIELRINRLLYNGQIIERNGRYYIGNPIILLITKIIVMMKLIFLGKKSEFD